VGADLERVQGQAQVVDRAGRAGEVKDEVDRLLDEPGLREVVVDEDEVGAVLDVLDVLQRAGVEVVDADDAVPLAQEVVAEVRAQESRSTRYDGASHAASYLERTVTPGVVPA